MFYIMRIQSFIFSTKRTSLLSIGYESPELWKGIFWQTRHLMKCSFQKSTGELFFLGPEEKFHEYNLYSCKNFLCSVLKLLLKRQLMWKMNALYCKKWEPFWISTSLILIIYRWNGLNYPCKFFSWFCVSSIILISNIFVSLSA